MKRRDRKPNLQQFMQAKVASIRKAFQVPMHVTIIVRHPTNAECEVVITDDNPAALIATLERRLAQLQATRAPFGVTP
jgi:hypothetical protein